LVERVAA